MADLFAEIVPFPRWLLTNQVVAKRLKVKEVDPRQTHWAGLGRDKLVALLVDEWDRAKLLDDKLFKQTAVLSVAVTAAGVASRSVLDAMPAGVVKIFVFGVILYAILSLFGGVLIGFSGVRPKERAGYGPDFALLIRHDNKASASLLADALMHFEITNLLRANEASAANATIRNGVVAFALAMILSLFLPAKPTASTSSPVVVNERTYTDIQDSDSPAGEMPVTSLPPGQTKAPQR